VGKTIIFNNTKYSVISIDDAIHKTLILLVSAGSETSKKWTQKFF